MNVRVATKYINYLNQNFQFSQESLNSIKYSFLSIIGEAEKFALLLLFFSIMGKAKIFIFCYMILISLRSFAGGLHFNGFWSCYIFSFVYFVLSITLLPQLVLSQYFYIIIGIINICICVFFSPAMSKKRPKKSKNKYYAYKIISSSLTCLYMVLFILVSKKSNSPFFWIVTLQNIQLIIGKEVNLYENKKLSKEDCISNI